MHDDSYQLIGKDQMEPSILIRRLRPWRPEDASKAQDLVHGVLNCVWAKGVALGPVQMGDQCLSSVLLHEDPRHTQQGRV